MPERTRNCTHRRSVRAEHCARFSNGTLLCQSAACSCCVALCSSRAHQQSRDAHALCRSEHHAQCSHGAQYCQSAPYGHGVTLCPFRAHCPMHAHVLWVAERRARSAEGAQRSRAPCQVLAVALCSAEHHNLLKRCSAEPEHPEHSCIRPLAASGSATLSGAACGVVTNVIGQSLFGDCMFGQNFYCDTAFGLFHAQDHVEAAAQLPERCTPAGYRTRLQPTAAVQLLLRCVAVA